MSSSSKPKLLTFSTRRAFPNSAATFVCVILFHRFAKKLTNSPSSKEDEPNVSDLCHSVYPHYFFDASDHFHK